MPIYEYACTACGHHTDILHGINDPGPTFCPACGREGTLRKRFAPPTIHFRGSGWAKKDRIHASSGKRGASSDTKPEAASESGDGAPAASSSSASSPSGSSTSESSSSASPSSSPSSESSASGSSSKSRSSRPPRGGD